MPEILLYREQHSTDILAILYSNLRQGGKRYFYQTDRNIVCFSSPREILSSCQICCECTPFPYPWQLGSTYHFWHNFLHITTMLNFLVFLWLLWFSSLWKFCILFSVDFHSISSMLVNCAQSKILNYMYINKERYWYKKGNMIWF